MGSFPETYIDLESLWTECDYFDCFFHQENSKEGVFNIIPYIARCTLDVICGKRHK